MRINLHDGFYLSPVQEGDQAAYVEHLNDKATSDCLLKIPYPYTQKDAEFWVRSCTDLKKTNGRPHHFAFRREDDFLIGGIGLYVGSGTAAHRGELGYWLAKDYRGRGLASAGTQAIVLFGLTELGLKRIEATTSTHNQSSQHVLERAGFTREGLLASYHIKDGNLIDVYMFSTLDPAAASPS